MKHYSIPFFISHEGCPNRCIFCDQNKITGSEKNAPEDVAAKIDVYLRTIDSGDSKIEIGFFGGSFTALDRAYQENLLEPVQRYIKEGKIAGIRLSTRPDHIDEEILKYLKEKNVNCIELGVQSVSDSVLKGTRRGHTYRDIVEASRLILKKGFVLGHQIMVGLPYSSKDDEYLTALKVKEARASEVRIYPVLVVKGTELAELWSKREYIPLVEQEAVDRCARLTLFFLIHNIKIIRCGLHPSEGLLDGSSYLAGPFHTAFGEKVRGRVFGFYLEYINLNFENIKAIGFNPKDKGFLFGHDGSNKELFLDGAGRKKYVLTENEEIKRGDLLLYYSDKNVLLDKKKVAREILPEILRPKT